MKLPGQYGKILYHLTDNVTAEDLEAVLHEFIVFLQREQAVNKIDSIVSAFEIYAKEKMGISVLFVESARPLGKKETREIGAVFGAKVEVRCAVEPSHLGGLVIRVGDRRIDGSLRMQMHRLAVKLA